MFPPVGCGAGVVVRVVVWVGAGEVLVVVPGRPVVGLQTQGGGVGTYLCNVN
jgi:hypothetical protein